MLTMQYNSYPEYGEFAEAPATLESSSTSVAPILISVPSSTSTMYSTYYNSNQSPNFEARDFGPNSEQFVPKTSSTSTFDYQIIDASSAFSSSSSTELPPLQSAAAAAAATQLSVTIGSGTIQQQTFTVCYDPMQIPKDTYGCRLSIVEQPTNRIRYRYRSEKGSHGGLNGVNSSQIKKTYPTVKLEGYHQTCPVYVRASLATNEDHPKQHVHKLMGRHCSEDGSCTLPATESMTTTFQNLGILFIGKKEVPEILFKRKLADFQNRFYGEMLTEKGKEKMHEQSEKEAKDMNLNSVKICFEAFMLRNDTLYPICNPVYSRPIANQKSPDSGELKIVRINRYCGSVAGGDEVYLLCEKVNKKEIRVRFFELDPDGNQQWEAFGHFNESDVHHQVAIVFRTPPYRDQNILKPAQVFLQLYRQRDGEFSEPRTFIYKPKSVSGQLNEYSMETLTSKCGIKECVLSRIKMENQPPGYKRRKYGGQQASFGQKCNSVRIDKLEKKSSTLECLKSGVIVKREIETDHVTCIDMNQIGGSVSKYTNGRIGGDNYPQDMKNPNIEYLDTPKPISLASPHSISSPSSTSLSSPQSTASSSASLGNGGSMMPPPSMPVSQPPTQHQAIDFDHLDSMWSSTSTEPSLVGDFFFNFMPLTSGSTTAPTASTTAFNTGNASFNHHFLQPIDSNSMEQFSPTMQVSPTPPPPPASLPIVHQPIATLY